MPGQKSMLHLDPLDPYKPPSCSGNKPKQYNNNNNNIGRFPGQGLENQNPARTIAHSPPGVKETLNYMLQEKTIFVGLAQIWEVSDMAPLIPEVWL